MPDGVPAKGKRVAIYQCAEDGIADTIKPRLQQAGADCERVAYIIDNDIALTLEDGRIETAIKDTHASVFIIDPIQAFIPVSYTHLATIFGLDEDKLRNMMGLNLNEATINEFGRFDELKKSVDKSKAKAFFEAYEQTKLLSLIHI